MAGPYHLEKGIVCQDSFYNTIKEATAIAAVADGLGSETHSDIGSSIASKVAVEYCYNHYYSDMSFDETKEVMHSAFNHAWDEVKKQAQADKNSIEQYDTTLCLAIFNGKKLYYGQSGDSGIIALLENGLLKVITKQQRDEFGNVYPLCFQDKWEFGEINENIHSIMLVTDGVLEQMVPPTVNALNQTDEPIINIPNAYKFLNRTESKEKDIKKVYKNLYEYLKNYPSYALNDDKTLVLIWNGKTTAKRLNEQYYAPINWDDVFQQIQEKISLHDKEKLSQTKLKEDSTLQSSEAAINIITNVENDSKAEILKQKKDKNSAIKKTLETILSNRLLSGCLIIALILFSILMWIESNYIKEHQLTTLISVFLYCFFSNATVLLPSSSLLMIIQSAMLITPLGVSVVAALGCTAGEIMSFSIGFLSSSHIEKNERFKKMFKRIEPHFKKSPFLLVFLFSLVPLPLFDIIGLLSGLYKLNIYKYSFFCFIGKLIKCLFFAFSANTIFNLLNH